MPTNKPRHKPNLQHDNLWRLLFTLSPPGILGMLLVSLNALIDAVYVGHLLGETAVAGMSVALPLSILTTAVTSLVSSGTASRLSRALGAQNTGLQHQAFMAGLLLTVLAGILLSVIGYLMAAPLIGLMGGYDVMAQQGGIYYKTLISGGLFSVLGVASSAWIRAEGNTRRAMLHLALALVVNVMTTPVLIFSLGHTIAGAAMGTVVSMIVYTSVNLHYFLTGKSAFTLGKITLIKAWAPYQEILAIGVSGLLLQLTQFVRQVFVFKLMTTVGSLADVAFLGVVFRIFSFSVMPVFGIVQAMQPVTGVNFGAKNFDRCQQALRVFQGAGFGLMLLIALPSLLFPNAVLSLILPKTVFTTDNLFYFRVVMLCVPFMAIGATGVTFFQSIGRSKPAFYLPLIRNLLLFIPMILIWTATHGKAGIYYTIGVENVVFAMVVCALTHWQARLLKNETTTSPL